MKKFLLIATLLFSISGYAQPEERGQRVQALYVAYITQQLKLTEDEAQKFWPVHSQYEGEVRGVKLDLSELDRQQAILNIKKKYQDKFVRILGSNRTDDFFRKDGEFKKRLIEQLKNRKRANSVHGD